MDYVREVEPQPSHWVRVLFVVQVPQIAVVGRIANPEGAFPGSRDCHLLPQVIVATYVVQYVS